MTETPEAGAPLAQPKAADSGGQEQGGDAWGKPSSWAWNDPLRVAAAIMQAEPGFWVRVALMGGAITVIPIFALFLGPFLTVLTVGGAYEQFHGESDATVSGTLDRWSSRVLPCYGLILIGMLIFSLIMGLAIGGCGGTWFGFRALAGAEVAEQPLTVIVLALLGCGVVALGMVISLRWTAFAAHAVVVEGENPVGALGRSARIVDTGILELIGISLGVTVIYMVLSMAMAMVTIPMQVVWTIGTHVATESEILRWILGLPVDFLDATLRMGMANYLGVTWLLIFLRQRSRLGE